MKEAVFYVIGWYMPYFRLFPFVFSEQYREGEISGVVIFVSFFRNFDMYLILIFWKSVENNQPFFWRCLASFLLTSSLVLC